MLLRAPIAMVKNGTVSGKSVRVVVVRRRYPGFTPKELVDENARELARDGACEVRRADLAIGVSLRE